MTRPGKSVAPWSDQQVDGLNAWQTCRYVHPFTCAHAHGSRAARVLIATREGWRCPTCDYTQNWAHDFMTEGAPPDPVAGLLT